MIKSIIRNKRIKGELDRWREQNSHNDTSLRIPLNYPKCVTVGRGTYGVIYADMSNPNYRLSIGSYCSIAQEVTFILGSDHPTDCLSTFPFRVKSLHSSPYEAIAKGNIVVDDDVWIGYRSTILSGVHIGQGAVVAAGSVVTKDVPPYAIVGGVPAKVIKYRFDEATIQKLLQLDYSKLDEKLIAEHVDDLYKKLDDTVDLSWFPQKGK